MTYEEIEKIVGQMAGQMRQIEDAQVVQGVLEHRLERRIDGLAAMVEVTNQSVQSLSETILVMRDTLVAVGGTLGTVGDTLGTVGDTLATLIEQAKDQEERTARLEQSEITMRAAMEALFERMDRFIRGLEGNGHKR